jgi:hypothetical protein
VTSASLAASFSSDAASHCCRAPFSCQTAPQRPCFWQAVLGLRWFRDRTTADALARDHGISRATAYRYLDEVVTVLAQEAPDVHEALERGKPYER